MLTAWAAVALVLLMFAAAATHVRRHEYAVART
ncbi:MAG: hypothetical protein KY460_17215 [Actinobacteria bacterium]|nr:hypothetical protein [Actinomycetota bacterium]